MQETETSGSTAEEFALPEWTPEPLRELWELVSQYAIVGFLILAVLSWIAGKLAVFVIGRTLLRLTRQTKTEVDDQIAARLQRPIFITVFFGGLAFAFRSLNLSHAVTAPTVQVLKTLVVLSWLGAGFPISRLLLDTLSRYRDKFMMVEERTLPLFEIAAKLILLAGGSYAVLLIWNIDLTAWLASAGVIGIAVGFAARDTLANLFAGFFIVTDAPYTIGDFIVLESGERGRVVNVGIRSTRLETRDDIEITIPNASIANAKIINESGGKWEKERIRIKVGVAYGSDLDKVCEVLEKIAVGHKEVCGDPAPRVRLRGFGDSSVDFELLCWIEEPVLRGKLSHDLYMDIYKTFTREDIEIPYPKHDVYVHKMPS